MRKIVVAACAAVLALALVAAYVVCDRVAERRYATAISAASDEMLDIVQAEKAVLATAAESLAREEDPADLSPESRADLRRVLEDWLTLRARVESLRPPGRHRASQRIFAEIVDLRIRAIETMLRDPRSPLADEYLGQSQVKMRDWQALVMEESGLEELPE